MLDRSASRAGAVRLRDFVLQGIANGALRPGEQLPTERELVDRFMLARSTVRRTLAALETEGRIARFVGRGTFIIDPAPREAVDPLAEAPLDTSPAELMEARLLIEPALAEIVVTKATDFDLERIERHLASAEAAPSIEAFERHDNAFHEAIVAATHNHFLIGIYGRVSLLRREAEWGKLKERSMTAQRRAAYQREHRRIMAALRDRDPARARAAMIGHLRHICRNMFEPRAGGSR
ncbi:MAG: FadR/GntR family transcriptional regulator [Stellaceae bacterium]